MKFIAEQEVLKSCLFLVTKAIPSRPTHPILANVLMVVKESQQTATLTGFDLNLGIKTTLSVNAIEGGEITLPAKLLSDIINKLPNGTTTIEVESRDDENPFVTIISSTGGKYTLRGVTSEEYPELPLCSNSNKITIPTSVLFDSLKVTLHSVSHDEAKNILTGIHLIQKQPYVNEGGYKFDGYFELASTDGHRLSVVRNDSHSDQEFELTIPAKTLKEVNGYLASVPKIESVDLFYEDNLLMLSFGDTIFTSRKLDGAFPNYSQLIPNKFGLRCVVERKALLEAVDRVGIMATDKNNMIILSITRNEVTVSSNASDLGSAKETILCESNNEDLYRIGFNIKYLSEALKSLDSSEVKINCNSPQQPVIINPLNAKAITILVMPVQIKE